MKIKQSEMRDDLEAEITGALAELVAELTDEELLAFRAYISGKMKEAM